MCPADWIGREPDCAAWAMRTSANARSNIAQCSSVVEIERPLPHDHRVATDTAMDEFIALLANLNSDPAQAPHFKALTQHVFGLPIASLLAEFSDQCRRRRAGGRVFAQTHPRREHSRREI